MSNVIKKATNTFTKGLVMDFSPENTRNEVLTHALNATLLTFNGNELSLLNDMGNGRVETAYLPEGYIPVGTCEYGGIIYIVSYNPLENKSLIGCFPSPERNISHDELGESNIDPLSYDDFLVTDANGDLTGQLKNTIQHIVLRNDKLNPGDKYIVCANNDIYSEKLSGLEIDVAGLMLQILDPIVSLKIVSIQDSGKIVELDSTVRKYTKLHNNTNYAYHILGTDLTNSSTTTKDIDSYRNTLSSGYNVFKSKTSGKLAILAELIMIDSFSVTYSLEPAIDAQGQPIQNTYDVTLHPEITTLESQTKYNINPPKLSYYYLETSEGCLQVNSTATPLPGFTHEQLSNGDTIVKFVDDSNILNYSMGDLYDPNSLPNSISLTTTISNYISHLQFAKPNTHHNDLFSGPDYKPVSVGTVTLPTVSGVSIPLNLEYNYKIVPCMNYGRLDHLAISNTIDFSKLRDFDSSTFDVWKYRVDGGLLRLTFGAIVNDLVEHYKVDGLVLEFYDLWGFAGSLTIENKNSYSGEFTKIIPLNITNALSQLKIHFTGITTRGYIGTTYNTFSRNINIKKDTDIVEDLNNLYNGIYVYNGNAVALDIGNQTTPSKGWIDFNGDPIKENDCGTLYKNIIYGVKLYLRRPDPSGGTEYILKNKFFLFTSTMYNDYYYNIKNYHTQLRSPTLDFVLTYRLYDLSDSSPFSNTLANIVGGYSNDSTLKSYSTSETYNQSLQGIKYYKYSGTSKLHLEIGLNKEYENLGISCVQDVNNYFTCDLELLNDDSLTTNINPGSYTINSNKGTNDQSSLNYPSGHGSNWNYLQFSNGNNSFSITNDFLKYNFIPGENDYIPINYEFVVGYKVNIDNIKYTDTPITTVCALCHKQDNDSYNYEDFGVYLSDPEASTPEYLSKTILYNSGSVDKSEFGVLKLISTTGTLISDLCSLEYYTECTAEQYTQSGKLNSGNPLNDVLPYIGKLSFCLPYSSVWDSDYGVNVSYCEQTKLDPDGILENYFIHPYIVYSGYVDTFGCEPTKYLHENPRYLLSLNTKKSIDYLLEFVTTMEYEIKQVKKNLIVLAWYKNSDEPNRKLDTSPRVFKYAAFTGELIATFNKKLMLSMKDIYAYNPDYDTKRIQLGTVSVEDLGVNFTSHLLSSNADLQLPSALNNYVAIGNMLIASYLRCLQKNSLDNTRCALGDRLITETQLDLWEPQVNFQPGLYYCGKSLKLLLSHLTYNTPPPKNLTNDLTFSTNNTIFVRHNDGTITLLKGTINENALYTFKSDTNQLIQLDVSNYEVLNDGKILLIDPIYVQNYPSEWDNKKTVKPAYINTLDSFDINLNYSTDPDKYGNDTAKYLYVGNKIIARMSFTKMNTYLLFNNNPRFEFNITDTNRTIKNQRVVLRIYTYFVKNKYNDILLKDLIQDNTVMDVWNTFTTGKNLLKDWLGNLLESNADLTNIIQTLTYSVSIDNTLESRINEYPVSNSVSPLPIEYSVFENTSLSITPTNMAGTMINMLNGFFLVLIEVLGVEIASTHNIPYDTTTSIVHIDRIWKNHWIYNDYEGYKKYEVRPEYAKALFKGSSITVSDLVYQPNKDGHRLYMRNGCYSYSVESEEINSESHTQPSAKLFYREIPEGDELVEGETTYRQNGLFVNSGPCFIKNNL